MDLAPESIEHARRRAEAEGMEITFEVGDAEDLSYPDASFDVVLSTIGVMFCPNQEKAASELLRVCKPGGKIGLASWTPDSFTGNMLKTVGKHVPPPPGVKPPSLWGTEERLQELLGEGVSSLQTERRTYNFRYPSVEHYVEWFREYYGPTVRAFAALEPEGREALGRSELLWLWASSVPHAPIPAVLDAQAVRDATRWWQTDYRFASPLDRSLHTDGRPYAGPGRTVFTGLPWRDDDDPTDPSGGAYVELHADGSAFAATPIELNTGAPDGGIGETTLVDDLIVLVDACLTWTIRQTGAWGNADLLTGLRDGPPPTASSPAPPK